MHNLKFNKISVALCLVLLPVSVFAAGLGKLNVQSGIGEPLKADIEILSASPEELDSISASIAPQEAYAAQGIDRPGSHSDIKVIISKNASGKPILKLNSSQPISDPFLDMLIQVDWNSGRLLREYTVLLDPPGYKGETDPNAQTASSVQSPQVEANTTASTETKAAKPAVDGQASEGVVKASKKQSRKNKKQAVPEEQPVPEVATDLTGQEYTTQKGDTLSKIARELKPEGVSLEQMLVGLYDANPDAFSAKNMNRLNVGKIIKSPSVETLKNISQTEAVKEIKVQSSNWNGYKNKLAGIVADAPSAESESSQTATSGKIKAAAEDKSAPAANGPKDVVKLSAADASAGSGDKAAQAKIAALQEEATAKEKNVQEAKDRQAALEKQIADMQKLLALKNNSMSEMQKQAEAKTEPAKPAETEAPKPAEPAKVEAPVPAKPEEPAETKPVEAAPAPKPVVVPPPPAPAAEEPGFISSMLGGLDSTMLTGLGGLVAALGGGWLYLRHKRKKNLADFEQGIMTSGGLKANTVFGNTSSSSVDTGDTSFLTDFSQSASGGMIDTNDVDPIAEAEVYMAYGRDAQAEEILKDAISKEPKRYELHLKLLEMYAASNNVSAFEAVSGELYTTLGADDPTWAKVAEIGIKLEPNNPLYQANPAGADASKSASTNKTSAADSKLDASDFANSPLASEKDLDFSFDNKSLMRDTEPGLPEPAVKAVDSEVAKLSALGGGLAALVKNRLSERAESEKGIDFNLEEAKNEEPAAPEALAIPASDEQNLDFDLGDLNLGDADQEAAAPQVEEDKPEFGNTIPDLDLYLTEAVSDNRELPSFEASSDESEAPQTVTFEDTAENLKAEVVDFGDTPAEQEESTAKANLSFDSTTITIPEEKSNPAVELNPIDLSGIDLDLGESAEADAASGDEPDDVETKLDLVTAYIEMDDKEGAKELLEEVLKEGGVNQRKRAEALIAKLG